MAPRNAHKRGGQQRRVDVRALEVQGGSTRAGEAELVLAVDRALESLTHSDPFKARIVDLRFFGDFTINEVAEILDTSPSTIGRAGVRLVPCSM